VKKVTVTFITAVIFANQVRMPPRGAHFVENAEMTSTAAASPTPSSTPPPRHGRRLLGVGLLLLVATGCLVAALKWVVPHLFMHTVPAWVTEKTGRTLIVKETKFNPFTLSLRISGAVLSDGTHPLASLESAEIKGSWTSLVERAWTADSVTLNKLEIDGRIGTNGSLDWARFLDALPKSTAPPSDTIARVVLHNVAIVQASIRLRDERAQSQEKRLDLTPLSFKVDRLSTLPKDRGDYALRATLNDQTRVQWRGSVGLNPMESSGDLAITHLPLARVQSIANLALPVALAGVANFSATYSVVAGTDFVAAGMGDGALEIVDFRASQNKDEATAKSIKVSPLSASWARTKNAGRDQHVFAVLPMSAAVSAITVKAGEQQDALLSIAQASTVLAVNIDLANRRIGVPQIAISGVQIAAERARNGAVALPFASAPIASPTPPAAVAATNSWHINVAEIVVDKAALALRDQSFSIAQSASAKLDFTLGATVTTGDKPSVRIATKRFSLTDFSLRDDAVKEPWLTVKEARAAPFDSDVLGSKIELPKFDLSAAVLNVALSNDGVDIAKKLSPAELPLVTVTAKTSTAPKLSIAGVNLSSARVNFTDSTLPTALTHVFEAVKIDADRIDFDGSRPVSATASATLASGGALQMKFKFDQRVNAGNAELSVERVTLAALSPYLNRRTRLQIGKGEAAVAGRLMFSGASNAAETLRFEGNAALRNLDLIDETTQLPFAQWAELSSTDIKLVQGSLGTDVALADLLLDEPRGKLIIGEDGRVNLAQIGKVDVPTPQPSASPVVALAPVDTEKKPRVKVDRLQVTGGNIEFADLSLRPQFGVRISDLAGLVVGLSTEPSSRAEVSLEGKVDEFGLARLSGNLSPLGATEYTDLKATFRNLEMKNLTPYSGKFAGRTIVSGKLSLDLEYKINQRKLKGENQIIIDNLTLGERVDSKDATSLPLDLALALLRDSKGVIDLGLPVQGSLDDPQFNYGSLIWKAIVNVLTKIVTAPFRALGALLGGSGEEFEAVIFEPGEARLLPPEREKLAKLAKALEQRPQLKLAIEGRFDKLLDREALADTIVKLEISKRAGMKPPAANEPLIISFTDVKVQTALDDLGAATGDDATKLRAQFLPPARNAVTGALQNAREKLTDKGRNEAAEARNRYYPELFKLLKAKQVVPDIAYATLGAFRGEAVKNTLTAVNKFDAARVSVAAPQSVKSSTPEQVATTLALSVK
jgi:hypothetical protein